MSSPISLPLNRLDLVLRSEPFSQSLSQGLLISQSFFSDLCYRKGPVRSCTPTSETSCVSHNKPSTIGISHSLLISLSAIYFQACNSKFVPAVIYVASLTNSHKSSSESKNVTEYPQKKVLSLSATI